MTSGLKKCEQNHIRCLMWKDGKCVGLNATDFSYHCPFYKERLKMSIEEVDEYNNGLRYGFKPRVIGDGLSASEINGRKKGVTW